MVAKTLTRSLLACALTIAAVPMAYSQDQRKSDAHNPRKQQSGLLDYALQGVNSSGQNYGQCFDEARQLLIHETLERALFWSNLCSITVAGFLFVVVFYQRQFQRRSEKVTSEVIAQYHNALERAEAQITEAATRNHGLMKALSISAGINLGAGIATSEEQIPQRRSPGRPARESVQAATKTSTQSKTVDASGSTKTIPSTNPSAPAGKATAVLEEKPKPIDQTTVGSGKPDEKLKDVEEGTSKPADHAVHAGTPSTTVKVSHQGKAKPVDQMGLFGSEVEFINKINVLQQQLSSSQEREKHLRRQLNDSELRFQKEQQKSRTLQP